MRTDDRDSPSADSNARALDEFAAETADQSPEKASPDGVFCFETEAEPEPELSVKGTLLEIEPAAVSHSAPEPLSRIDARSARRRRSAGRRLATRFVAERNLITEAGSTIKDSAERASTAAARRVAAARERSGDLAAVVSKRTSDAIRHGRRAARRLALRMQTRAAASRARMVSERETITKYLHYGMVVLGQTLSNVTHRSMDAVINLAVQSAAVLGDGRRASNRVVRRQVAATRAQTRSQFVVARNRLDRGLIALAIAAGTVARRSGRAAAHLSQRTSPLLSEARRAVHRFAILAWSRSVAAAESMNALGERARMSALRSRPILSRALARPLEPALNRQEFNGLVVAVVLAVAAVGYGGFLAVGLGTHTDGRGIRLAASAAAPGTVADRSLAQASAVNAPGVVRTIAANVEGGRTFTPSARTLTALWQRRDTRSLDRAFSAIRRETLAFRSCGMRMTEVDRAVARCEGVLPALAADGTASSRSGTWTIHFQRTGGRWLIARVATR